MEGERGDVAYDGAGHEEGTDERKRKCESVWLWLWLRLWVRARERARKGGPERPLRNEQRARECPLRSDRSKEPRLAPRFRPARHFSRASRRAAWRPRSTRGCKSRRSSCTARACAQRGTRRPPRRAGRRPRSSAPSSGATCVPRAVRRGSPPPTAQRKWKCGCVFGCLIDSVWEDSHGACACALAIAQATEVKKTDFQRIEFLLRQGQKKLKVLAHADVTGFSVAPSAGSAGSRAVSER